MTSLTEKMQPHVRYVDINDYDVSVRPQKHGRQQYVSCGVPNSDMRGADGVDVDVMIFHVPLHSFVNSY
jgi:hypothetical protein